ncbi:MAG: hypothetical protein JSS86_13190 [Cyanobacteria bacterium SZAS LIN-2]|nr:hypothetical protein [Cyanobacteria bacterium SZAS LIN-3]MBS1997266.1 hypothetical protein [Cyanobacteria bacterium SZAS LIN-2]
MTNFTLKIQRPATIASKRTPEPGHEHHTQIDSTGTGTPDMEIDPKVIVDNAMKRAAKAERRAKKRLKKAGKDVSPSSSFISVRGSSNIVGKIVVPNIAPVVPAGETKETYIPGKNLLTAADGMQGMMMNRMFDGYYEERFGDLTTIAAWGSTNLSAKKQDAAKSLARQLDKANVAYRKALPDLTNKLAKLNPKAPIQAVIAKAVELIDQELARVLYVLNIYCESIKQLRDGRFATELSTVETFFDDAFRLYFAGDLHCGQDGKPVDQQLPSSTYKVGDVFMARVTASGLATIPGTKGPIGANALQLPFEMLDILMLVLPLLGHEARHNVYHDVQGLEEEMLAAVEKAIRDAHAAGTLKFEKEDMQLGDQTVATIDLVVKLMCDWLSEIDADVVGGVLFSGPSFGDNMVMSFPAMMVRDGSVSSKTKLIRTESRFDLVPQKDGSTGLIFEEHPVDYIRINIVAAALEEIGFAEPGKKLRQLADFAVGDELPKEIVYKDAEGKSDLVIKFSTADLIAVAPVVAKAIIRTKMESQLGKSCGDLVMWNDKRQAKVDVLTDLLAAGVSDLPTDKGSIFATYVGAAASQAYLKLVHEGKMEAKAAAKQVNGAALKMIASLSSLAANQCPVVTATSEPATATK